MNGERVSQGNQTVEANVANPKVGTVTLKLSTGKEVTASDVYN